MTNDFHSAFWIIPLFVLSLILFFQYIGRFIYSYRTNGSGIKVVLFGFITTLSIEYADIVEIRKISFREACFGTGFLTLRYGNRLWGDIVLIRKSRGFFHSIVITPDNTEEFISEVQRNLDIPSQTGNQGTRIPDAVNPWHILAIIAIIAIIGAVFYPAVFKLGEQSEPYAFAKQFIAENALIAENIGSLENFTLVSFNISERSGNAGYARLSIKVSGTAGGCVVRMELCKSDGVWSLASGTLTLENGATVPLK